ncbi:pilus assembly PilX family protein [Undibacterium flavidum]|uniref:Type IV pilus assembly protein PilX n=1 Tax=Undibacterium flavidum TaxID=2762297 RepID=A0ABR6YDI4_9BURK|nr:PilX N-terminal domain-containing pilus assembly protein [Undibacterium flavidum]MBC3874615.1 hypothetical protein [Undibacterium flavidum]
MRFNFIHRQQGFVLVVSMIFLIIMTMLAVTAIKKATMDEKVTSNLRAQDMAFQAAEKALRLCESSLILEIGDTNICKSRIGSTIPVIPSTRPSDVTNVNSNFPNQWSVASNWQDSGGAYPATRLIGASQLPNVVEQPRCMIERWEIPNERGKDFYPYVITARGVGSSSTAVVWLQEIIRCGNN